MASGKGEVVYTADAYRGADVLRIAGGGRTGKKVKAPVSRRVVRQPDVRLRGLRAELEVRLHVPAVEGRSRDAVAGRNPGERLKPLPALPSLSPAPAISRAGAGSA